MRVCVQPTYKRINSGRIGGNVKVRNSENGGLLHMSILDVEQRQIDVDKEWRRGAPKRECVDGYTSGGRETVLRVVTMQHTRKYNTRTVEVGDAAGLWAWSRRCVQVKCDKGVVNAPCSCQQACSSSRFQRPENATCVREVGKLEKKNKSSR